MWFCRVGSESLIPVTMWCRRCRHCCSELIGQSPFLTQLMGSWPLEEGFFVCWGSWETILTKIKLKHDLKLRALIHFVFVCFSLFLFFLRNLSLYLSLIISSSYCCVHEHYSLQEKVNKAASICASYTVFFFFTLLCTHKLLGLCWKTVWSLDLIPSIWIIWLTKDRIYFPMWLLLLL